MTTIAVPDTRPATVCPPWCTVSYEGHYEDLSELEGFVHWSDLSQRVYLGRSTYIDGTPVADDPPVIHLDGLIGALTLDERSRGRGAQDPRADRGGAVVTAALEVPLRTCTPWCENGDGHGDEHPEDRSCWSTFQVVPLSQHSTSKYTHGTWRIAYLNVYLRRLPQSVEPLLYVHSEETDEEIRLTLDEARRLRDELTAALGFV
jgi:hypothetical protein